MDTGVHERCLKADHAEGTDNSSLGGPMPASTYSYKRATSNVLWENIGWILVGLIGVIWWWASVLIMVWWPSCKDLAIRLQWGTFDKWRLRMPSAAIVYTQWRRVRREPLLREIITHYFIHYLQNSQKIFLSCIF